MASKHALTRQVLEGRAPVAVQEFAARGLLPLPRPEFLDIWVYLAAHGGTPEVRDLARQSLEPASLGIPRYRPRLSCTWPSRPGRTSWSLS